MRSIEQRNGCIYFYGNPAGYLDHDSAVVDTLFQTGELERWLSKNQLAVTWTDGVYERLASGSIPHESERTSPILKNCRIWQLKPNAAAWKDIVQFGKPLSDPNIEEYSMVYDGQLDTNNLEEIYDRFTERNPSGFTGHPLSVSDLVELYDGFGSAFYFLDRTCFRPVEFPEPEQEQSMIMTMSP